MVSLALTGLDGALGKGAAAALFVLDNSHGSAVAVWEAQGKPLFPTAAQCNHTTPTA